jgi:Endonuclease-reverse transcriptase
MLNCNGVQDWKILSPDRDGDSIQEMAEKCDIFGILETWYNEDVENSALKIPGFKSFHQTRATDLSHPFKKLQGGVSVYFREDVPLQKSPTISSDPDIFFATLYDVHLVLAYLRPPPRWNDPKYDYKPLKVLRRELRKRFTNNERLVILTDANSRTGNLQSWGDVRCSSDQALPNQRGREFIQTCESFDLEILNGKEEFGSAGAAPTCHHHTTSATVIDYAVTSKFSRPRVSKFTVGEEPAFSDHSPISLNVCFETDQTRPTSLAAPHIKEVLPKISALSPPPRNSADDVLQKVLKDSGLDLQETQEEASNNSRQDPHLRTLRKNSKIINSELKSLKRSLAGSELTRSDYLSLHDLKRRSVNLRKQVHRRNTGT